MKSRLVRVLALAAWEWFAAVHARPATRVLMPTPEVEPNNTPATSTPLGGIAPSNIPTLSFPMLLLMGLGLVASAFLLVRRL